LHFAGLPVPLEHPPLAYPPSRRCPEPSSS